MRLIFNLVGWDTSIIFYQEKNVFYYKNHINLRVIFFALTTKKIQFILEIKIT